MKKILITALIIAAGAAHSLAQNTNRSVGNWVIEYNSKKPKLQTVKFYNDSGKLVYQETVNTKLDIKNKTVQAKLNEICARLCEKDRLKNESLAVADNEIKKQ